MHCLHEQKAYPPYPATTVLCPSQLVRERQDSRVDLSWYTAEPKALEANFSFLMLFWTFSWTPITLAVAKAEAGAVRSTLLPFLRAMFLFLVWSRNLGELAFGPSVGLERHPATQIETASKKANLSVLSILSAAMRHRCIRKEDCILTRQQPSPNPSHGCGPC